MLYLSACCLIIHYVAAFNFDTDFPMVYTDPTFNANLNKERTSYFGYSIVLHRDAQEAWVQIGAPRANSTRIRAFEPGVVVRCYIFGHCTIIDVDTHIGSGDSYRGTFIDKKDKAWIGGSMDIDEWARRVVVCGHRWVNNRIADYWMIGACYWSYTNDTVSEKLFPLLDNGKGIIRDAVARINVFYFAQGQAGFTAHFSNSLTQTELVLGAPGVYNWDGTTLIYKDGPDTAPIASKYEIVSERTPVKRDVGFAEFSDLNIGNAIYTTQTGAFALFGYSITSGYFFNKNELLYVSGAPRSKHLIGQILIYAFAKTSDQALDVKDSRQGYQYGEYFGGALTAGDINEDGLDDLIVGSPFYTSNTYNEGRIYVFLGSKKGTFEIPVQNAVIEGKAIGAQFGNCLIYLNDLHHDGYADIAVGAPYELEGSGVVYIYRGTGFGLSLEPSQRIVGKDFVPNIKGFGISISKPVDVDGNSFEDLVVGAYGSGHAILFRSKPVVTLQQSIIALTPRLEHYAQSFQVKACFWYTGYHAPPFINIVRLIMVDEVLLRAYLPSNIPSKTNVTLELNNIYCQNVSVLIKNDLNNRYDPLTVSISQEIITSKVKPTVLYQNLQNRGLDMFCKSCPISNPYKSYKEQKIELSFALGCGNDNLCVTELDLKSEFLNIGNSNRYVLGSTDYLKLAINITNFGEKAYLTQLIVDLPTSVYFRSIPPNCLEQNTSSSVICNVENPLYENKRKTIILDLDMKEVNTGAYGDELQFKFTVLTSSENKNHNGFTNTLKLAREADILLSGKNSQQSYSYGNATIGKANFTQIYQVEKFGASTVDEVFLTIQVPTRILSGIEYINILQMYAPEGVHGGQPINCHSDIQYIIEESLNDISEYDSQADTSQFDKSDFLPGATTNYQTFKRKIREVDVEEQNLIDLDYPTNRTFYINCSNSDVYCSTITCAIGPFKIKQNTAILQLKMIIDISAISELLGLKDIIILSTYGMSTIKSPENFIQNGNRADSVIISSVFVGETQDQPIESWIIIISIIAGLLLLLLLIMGLIKAGFFQRTKKKELEALKEAEEVEEFKRNSDYNAEPCDFPKEND